MALLETDKTSLKYVFWKVFCFPLEVRHLSGELITCFYTNLLPHSQNKADIYFMLGNGGWSNIWTKKHELNNVWWP